MTEEETPRGPITVASVLAPMRAELLAETRRRVTREAVEQALRLNAIKSHTFQTLFVVPEGTNATGEGETMSYLNEMIDTAVWRWACCTSAETRCVFFRLERVVAPVQAKVAEPVMPQKEKSPGCTLF